VSLNLFSHLDTLPRVRLAHLPTPIEPLPNLSRFLGGPDLFIKRDDQTGLATGGNKARKLEFLLGQALQLGADSVITAGAVQSNHARQTAAGAARCGLDCHLVLRAPEGGPPRELTGNVLLDHVLGATIHWTTERAPYANTLSQVEAELRGAGKRPYVVPYGGSNPYGLLGYAVAMREYAAQARGFEPFDAHVFATSSGGTQSGMLLGAHLASLPDTTRILGISVDRPADQLVPEVVALANGGAELLGLNWRLDPSAVAVNDDYTGGGYAVIGDPEREAIRLLARHEGILADPVYTGRALAGLIDLVRRGEFVAGQSVLFWHTGGAAALFAFARELGSGESV
jgi:D-cysteine desulfhydrase family pyridoxal phosphate-dependent enzyme